MYLILLCPIIMIIITIVVAISFIRNNWKLNREKRFTVDLVGLFLDSQEKIESDRQKIIDRVHRKR